jgi:hypothetical protein
VDGAAPSSFYACLVGGDLERSVSQKRIFSQYVERGRSQKSTGPDGSRASHLFFLRTGEQRTLLPHFLSVHRHLLQAAVKRSQPTPSCFLLHPAPCYFIPLSTELRLHAPDLQQGDTQLSLTHAVNPSVASPSSCGGTTPLSHRQESTQPPHPPARIEASHFTHRQEATQPNSFALSCAQEAPTARLIYSCAVFTRGHPWLYFRLIPSANLRVHFKLIHPSLL